MNPENKYIKIIKQLFIYVLVGAGATVVEWVFFYLFNKGLHYFAATALAFILSTFANWALGKLMLFKKRSQSIMAELAEVYGASVIGLGLNLVIMWVAVEQVGIGEFPSKVLATGLVFLWNFLIRKLVIYRI